MKGLLYGDWGQFGAQVIGCLMLLVWAFGASWVFFKTVDKLIGMRVAPEVEVEGLDLAETGVLAYPNFTLTGTYSSTGVDGLHAPYRTEVRTPVAES